MTAKTRTKKKASAPVEPVEKADELATNHLIEQTNATISVLSQGQAAPDAGTTAWLQALRSMLADLHSHQANVSLETGPVRAA